MTSKTAQKKTKTAHNKTSKFITNTIPVLKNTSRSVIINLKDWENVFVDGLMMHLQIADCSTDEYDFDPNDDKFHGKYLKVIIETIRSRLPNEWKLINKSQNRNDGCAKITFKQFENIYCSLIKSLMIEFDQFKNLNKKYIVPFIEFFINRINAYFCNWWDTYRYFYDNKNVFNPTA